MFDLAPVDPYILTNPPLAQALAQVRFPLQARLATLEGIAVVQEQLSDEYPSLTQEQTQGIEVQFSPEGPQASSPVSSVSYTFSADDGFKIILTPESATLSVGVEYKGVEDFTNRFEQLVHVLNDILHIRRCERLGVRYLSTFDIPPGDISVWTRWFNRDLVGWIGSSVRKHDTSISTAITQVTLSCPNLDELSSLPSRLDGVVRHGMAPGGSTVPGIPPVQLQRDSYVLDVDLFVITPQAWDAPMLTDQFELLHSQIDRFFRWSLSSEGEELVGLEVT
jgi:uncharacterized protein (TIGR04255 family)